MPTIIKHGSLLGEHDDEWRSKNVIIVLVKKEIFMGKVLFLCNWTTVFLNPSTLFSLTCKRKVKESKKDRMDELKERKKNKRTKESKKRKHKNIFGMKKMCVFKDGKVQSTYCILFSNILFLSKRVENFDATFCFDKLHYEKKLNLNPAFTQSLIYLCNLFKWCA